MSDQKTQKSDVSVADFRTALAKSIRNSIESFSKRLEDLAQREIKKSDGYSAVGSFPLIESDLQVGGPICPVCKNADLPDSCTCLFKSVDREKVYHSYKQNVASRLFPGDEETQNKLGEAAAKVWEEGKKVSGKPEEVKVGKGEKCAKCGDVCKCMDKGEAKFTPTAGSKTQRRKQNLTDRKRLERWGTPSDVKNFDNSLKNLASKRPMNKEEWKEELGKSDEWLEKKTPPGVSEEKMHAMKDAMTKEYGAKKGKEVAYATAWKQHNAKKSEDFIDEKNANSPAASTDEAGKGSKRTKNIGAETPNPDPATKPVKGNIDEGSGGDVTKGKSTKKAEPPMAKPPSGKAPTPAAPPASKPKMPKMPKVPAPALGKAGLPMQTRMNAGDVQARNINAGHEVAPKVGAAPAPKAMPQPHNSYSDFMPAGKFTAAGPGLPGAKKSEEVEINFKKSLGNCVLCGKAEHAGDCK